MVRPSFVYGIGDRWLFPGITSFLKAADALPDTVDETRSSLIGAEELGRLMAGLAVRYHGGARTWNAVPPHMVATRDVCFLALHALGVDVPRATVPGRALRARALEAGLSEHQYDLIFNDHTYDPGDIWIEAEVTPAGTEHLPQDVLGWYRGQRTDTTLNHAPPDEGSRTEWRVSWHRWEPGSFRTPSRRGWEKNSVLPHHGPSVCASVEILIRFPVARHLARAIPAYIPRQRGKAAAVKALACCPTSNRVSREAWMAACWVAAMALSSSASVLAETVIRPV